MTLQWIKATASADAACVELAESSGTYRMRDSKDPRGPVLEFSRQEIAAFLDGAHKGEFDHLVV
jgi:hypothetical protein